MIAAGSLFGIETEFAASWFGNGEPELNQAMALERLMALAEERLVCLHGGESKGLYLGNGARLYIDLNFHPEYGTPECSDPAELLRHVIAGERILEDLVRELNLAENGGGRIVLFKGNVDYSDCGCPATWGCHESFIHRMGWELLCAQILPHLVTRIIYTGAGGFRNSSPGIEFLISPRVAHLQAVVSGDSTHDRGILHSKNEPLASGGCRRLHLICGESLSSHRASWLKIGTTALVLALAEAGLDPAREISLATPLESIHVVARDRSLSAALPLSRGGTLTAAAIQRKLLERVEAEVGKPFLPAWAGAVCEEWRRVLDGLESSPANLALILDWPLKLAITNDIIASRGFTWEGISLWNVIAAKLRDALDRTSFAARPLEPGLATSSASPIANAAAALTPSLSGMGLNWEGFDEFLRLRGELFTMAIRFSELGGDGIFDQLDRDELLDHRIPGVDKAGIEKAMTTPPEFTRARLRGECVQRFSREKATYKCDWSAIWDLKEGRKLDLSDPFERDERWIQMPGPAPPPPGAPPTGGTGGMLRDASLRARIDLLRNLFNQSGDPP